MQVFRAAALVAGLVFGLPALSAAQVSSGQITGIVTDSCEARVPGATVTATPTTRSTGRTVVTSSAGVYTLAGLTPGDYRIDIALSGFRTIRREGVRVETGKTVRLDLTLEVGGLSDTVTVVGDAPTLRANGSLGQVISAEKVQGLPLNGRSFITLASLVPGVAVPPASPLPRINGGRPRTNEYLFDGISVFSPSPGKSRTFPSSMRSRNSQSRQTARPRNSAASTGVWSTSRRAVAATSSTERGSNSSAMKR